MKNALLASGVLLGALAIPTVAAAQDAYVTADLNMRAGPGTRYPVVTTIPQDRAVDIYGCTRGTDWCDVGWRGNRGWVYSDYLEYLYQGRRVMLPEYRSRIDLPVVSFSFGNYWDRHYRDRPWYSDRGRWDRDGDRGRWDRDDDRDRWDGDDDRRDRGDGRDRDWDRGDWRGDGDRRDARFEDGRRGPWNDRGDDDRRRAGGDEDGDRRSGNDGRGPWSDRDGDDRRRGGGDGDRGRRSDDDRRGGRGAGDRYCFGDDCER